MTKMPSAIPSVGSRSWRSIFDFHFGGNFVLQGQAGAQLGLDFLRCHLQVRVKQVGKEDTECAKAHDRACQ